LPVTISGIDAAGSPFHEIAHTLDITSNGARLGAIHRRLREQDLVILQHRHRNVEFRVVWIKSLEDRGEYQVGLQMVVPGKCLASVNTPRRCDSLTVLLGVLILSGGNFFVF
jgi:hypothetical protein